MRFEIQLQKTPKVCDLEVCFSTGGEGFASIDLILINYEDLVSSSCLPTFLPERLMEAVLQSKAWRC